RLHPVQGRRGPGRATRLVPRLLQLLPAPWEVAPAPAPADSDQWDGLGQAMAALYTRDGRRVDGPRVVAERSPPVPGAAVATASRRGGSQQGCEHAVMVGNSHPMTSEADFRPGLLSGLVALASTAGPT